MKKFYKILSFLLILSLLNISVFAETPTTGDLSLNGNTGIITWKLDSDGTLTISGNGKMKSFYNNYLFEGASGEVKTVIIQDGVENIGAYIFSMCENMISIYIPLSVKEIGAHAFENATSLMTVYYEGTNKQWQDIIISPYGNDSILTSNIVYSQEPHEHEFGDWEVNHNPTCVENGSKVRYCNCGFKDIEEIPATGVHTFEFEITKEPKCTEKGVKSEICNVCNTIRKTEEVDAIGHKKGEWITEIEATCNNVGSKVKRCENCGLKLEHETIEMLPHDFDNWKTVIKETEEINGLETRKCKSCDYKEERVIDNIKSNDGNLIGDANGDGTVTAVDARYVLQVVAQLIEVDDIYFLNADANNDNNISAVDARFILQIVAGIK